MILAVRCNKLLLLQCFPTVTNLHFVRTAPLLPQTVHVVHYTLRHVFRRLTGHYSDAELANHLPGDDSFGPRLTESTLHSVDGEGGIAPTSHQSLDLEKNQLHGWYTLVMVQIVIFNICECEFQCEYFILIFANANSKKKTCEYSDHH